MTFSRKLERQQTLTSSEESAIADARPTIIIGLGGTGGKIAAALKARLREKQSEMQLQNWIRFLCIDTANETFEAPRPNFPDEEPIQIERGTEFVRISDVPVNDLLDEKKRSQGNDDARQRENSLWRILPPRLTTTHIDQGAQQIRRLGRIALLYHYQRVYSTMAGHVRSLLRLDVDGNSDRDRRLQVFVICSLSGGTGSGTFIDVAAMARWAAVSAGHAPSERDVDVIGLFMLPEAFPEINSTGQDRIRANAYAALLDLEYFNQDTASDHALYNLTLPQHQVKVSGTPYNQVYLVTSRNRHGTIQNGMAELAPIMADALETMLVTRVGEQHAATLDNVKVALTAYHRGYRTFYSALGIAKLAYPRVWVQSVFTNVYRQALIERYVLVPPPGDDPIQEDIQAWFKKVDGSIREKLVGDIDYMSIPDELYALEGARPERIRNLREPLQRAFYNTRNRFESEFRTRLSNRVDTTIAWVRNELQEEIYQQIDRSVMVRRDHESPVIGLLASREWLRQLSQHITTERRKQADNSDLPDYQTVINNQIVNLRRNLAGPFNQTVRRGQSLAQAANELVNFFTRIAPEALIAQVRVEILAAMQSEIDQLLGRVHDALSLWKGEMQLAQRPVQPPIKPVTTTWIINESEIQQEIDQMMKATDEDRMRGDFAKVLKSLVSSQEQNHRRLSLSLESDLRLSLVELLYDHANQIFVELFERVAAKGAGAGSVQYYLNNTSADRTAEMMGTLSRNASPLLLVRDADLQAVMPPEIKVIGVQQSEGRFISRIRNGLLDASDVSFKSTGLQSEIIMLHTQHGIPLHALSTINTYQENYNSLIRQERAVFHIDADLERQPHDPGSAYFINFADFELLVIRAFAYGWIASTLDHNNQRTFHLSNGLHERLVNTIQQEMGRLRITLQQAGASFDESGGVHRNYRYDQQNDSIEENEVFIRTKNQYDELRAALRALTWQQHPDLGYSLCLPTLYQQVSPRLVRELAQLIDLFMWGIQNVLPRAFEQTFEALYLEQKQRDANIEQRIEKHLRDVQYYDKAGQRNNPDEIAYEFDVHEHEMELRLYEMLEAYFIFVQRARWNDERVAPGYYRGGQWPQDESSRPKPPPRRNSTPSDPTDTTQNEQRRGSTANNMSEMNTDRATPPPEASSDARSQPSRAQEPTAPPDSRAFPMDDVVSEKFVEAQLLQVGRALAFGQIELTSDENDAQIFAINHDLHNRLAEQFALFIPWQRRGLLKENVPFDSNGNITEPTTAQHHAALQRPDLDTQIAAYNYVRAVEANWSSWQVPDNSMTYFLVEPSYVQEKAPQFIRDLASLLRFVAQPPLHRLFTNALDEYYDAKQRLDPGFYITLYQFLRRANYYTSDYKENDIANIKFLLGTTEMEIELEMLRQLAQHYETARLGDGS